MRKTVCSVIFVIALAACDVIFPPKEIEPTLTFESELTPSSTTTLSQINRAMMEEAEKSGKNSAFQVHIQEEKTRQPEYSDLIVRPAFSRSELAALSSVGIQSKHTVLSNEQLDSIDFGSNWVLVVAHPVQKVSLLPETFGQMSATYFDTLLLKHSSGETLNLELKSGSLGTAQMFASKWASKAYRLERGNYKSIRIEIDGKSYDYEMKADSGES